MDLLLNFAAVFVLAIPLGFAAALFLRVAPAAFSFRPQADLPWPVGVQEEDPESGWARRATASKPVAPEEPDVVPISSVHGRVGRGSSRR
jgi:hypothetical protein